MKAGILILMYTLPKIVLILHRHKKYLLIYHMPEPTECLYVDARWKAAYRDGKTDLELGLPTTWGQRVARWLLCDHFIGLNKQAESWVSVSSSVTYS